MDAPGPDRSEQRWITAGQATLHAVSMGNPGAPAAVLLHEGISDHRTWTGVMDLLSPDLQLIAYDRRGFGSTTYEAEAHDQVEDLAAVLGASGLDRLDQVVVFGNSRGGAIALDFALAHPDRVTALVLTAPAVSGAPAAAPEMVDPVEAAVWQTLEEADRVQDLEALNEAEIRFWLDGPHAPEGRVSGPARQLALEYEPHRPPRQDPRPRTERHQRLGPPGRGVVSRPGARG